MSEQGEEVSGGTEGNLTAAAQPGVATPGIGDDVASSPTNTSPLSGEVSGTAEAQTSAGANPEPQGSDGSATASPTPAPAGSAAAGSVGEEPIQNPEPHDPASFRETDDRPVEEIRPDRKETRASLKLTRGSITVEGAIDPYSGDGARDLLDKLDQLTGATGVHQFPEGAARCAICDIPKWMATTNPCKVKPDGQADGEGA